MKNASRKANGQEEGSNEVTHDGRCTPAAKPQLDEDADQLQRASVAVLGHRWATTGNCRGIATPLKTR